MASPDPIPHMRSALAMAAHALATNETPVGCILLHPVYGLVSIGQNATNRTYNGTMHAEFIAINALLSPKPVPLPSPEGIGSVNRLEGLGLQERLQVLKECSLYVTVEPCIMCASLLRQFGVKKVFFGCGNDKFGGNGGVLDIHISNGKFTEADKEERKRGNGRNVGKGRMKDKDDYEISSGWLREEAILMLRRFYVQENGRAPEPRTKKERVLKLEIAPLKNDDENTKVPERKPLDTIPMPAERNDPELTSSTAGRKEGKTKRTVLEEKKKNAVEQTANSLETLTINQTLEVTRSKKARKMSEALETSIGEATQKTEMF